MNTPKPTAREVIDANIEYHTALVNADYEKQPYFHPENRRRVDGILAGGAGGAFLDIGCGTGFLLEMAGEHFKTCKGIDITPAMVEAAKAKGLDVVLGLSHELPFEDNTFDMIACNSFLHHLQSLAPTLKEIFRVLKPGGKFYADQEPNFYFQEMLMLHEGKTANELINNEYLRTIKEEEIYAQEYGIDQRVAKLAEYQKIKGGFREEDIRGEFEIAGFHDVEVHYHWYLAEKTEREASVRNYLHTYLPATRPLFKYFYILGHKGVSPA